MATRRTTTASLSTTEAQNINIKSAATGSTSLLYNEKGEKILRRAEQKRRMMTWIFSLFGCLSFIFVIGIVKVKHSRYKNNNNDEPFLTSSSSSLRRMTTTTIPEKQGEVVTSSSSSSSLLPLNSIYRVSVHDKNGLLTSLERYAGRITLIVNVACQWGKTELSYNQLSQLQQLYPTQFQIMAFPTNDYHQEFETNDEIQTFIQDNFPDVSFPIFGVSKLEENPVYKALQRQRPDYKVKQNFYKYLIDRQGNIIGFYNKKFQPLDIIPDIEKALSTTTTTTHHQQALMTQ